MRGERGKIGSLSRGSRRKTLSAEAAHGPFIADAVRKVGVGRRHVGKKMRSSKTERRRYW